MLTQMENLLKTEEEEDEKQDHEDEEAGEKCFHDLHLLSCFPLTSSSLAVISRNTINRGSRISIRASLRGSYRKTACFVELYCMGQTLHDPLSTLNVSVSNWN